MNSLSRLCALVVLPLMLLVSGCENKPTLSLDITHTTPLQQELLSCKSWPKDLWSNDTELARYIAEGYDAWKDCNTKHREAVKLLQEELNVRH